LAKSRAKNCGGQAAVELALVLPVIAVFALLVLQVGIVIRDQIALVHACGAAARAASISPSPDAAAKEVIERFNAVARASIEVTTGGGYVTVAANTISRTDLPIIGLFVPDVDLRAEATYEIQD
jgi:Flp pilus assembly protein TadG